MTKEEVLKNISTSVQMRKEFADRYIELDNMDDDSLEVEWNKILQYEAENIKPFLGA